MNRLLVLLLFGSIFLAAARSESAKSDLDELLRLIEDVPSPQMIDQYYRTIHQKDTRPEEVAFAHSQMAKGRESIPKLRKLIKIGTSIFDYPGLVTRGYATYDRRKYDKRGGAYTLFVSASFSGREGRSLPYEFRLTFDDKGLITALEDVTYK